LIKNRIDKGTLIGEYTGLVTPQHQISTNHSNYSVYFFNSPDETSYYIDSTLMGNETRFINDFRGINKLPNVKFMRRILLENGKLIVGSHGIDVISTRIIEPEEEILIDYGDTFWID